MADKYSILKRLLRGGAAAYKVPSERPSNSGARKVFDSFHKATQTLFGEGMVGAAERLERLRDYEEMDHYPEITRALDIYADDSMTYAEDGKTVQIISDSLNNLYILEHTFISTSSIELYDHHRRL